MPVRDPWQHGSQMLRTLKKAQAKTQISCHVRKATKCFAFKSSLCPKWRREGPDIIFQIRDQENADALQMPGCQVHGSARSH